MRNPFRSKASLTLGREGVQPSPPFSFPPAPLALIDELRLHHDSDGRFLAPLAMYLSHPGVRAAVDMLARNVAQLDIATHFVGSQGDEFTRISRANPMDDLLRNPDPSQPTASWKFALIVDLLVHGEALFALVDNEHLIRLDPLYVTVNGEGANIASYTVAGQTLPVEDVLHVMFFNPRNPRRGLSPLHSLRQLVAEDLMASQYRLRVWSGGNPGSWVERPLEAPQMKTEGKERISSWLKSLGPADTPVIDEGMILHTREQDAGGAEYVAGRQFVASQIAVVLGINPSSIGGSDKNLDAAHRALYGDAIAPLCALIEDAMNTQVVPRVMLGYAGLAATHGGIVVKFDLEAKLSIELANTRSMALGGAGYKTTNEVRADAGLPPIAGGDVVPSKAAPSAGGPEGS